jgi:hypothetical protein
VNGILQRLISRQRPSLCGVLCRDSIMGELEHSDHGSAWSCWPLDGFPLGTQEILRLKVLYGSYGQYHLCVCLGSSLTKKTSCR